MQSEGNVTLTIHGLAADNGLVRADVFLEKFRALLNSLKVADKAMSPMSPLMLKSAKRASLVENLRSLRGLDKVRVR
jgi:hypothetical protein